MRGPTLLLSLLPLTLLASVGQACGGSSSAAPDAGAGSSSGGSDSGSGGATLYTPQGCSYTYTPPDALKYQSLALDDEGPVSATAGAPERVRLGLGGGVVKGAPGYADPTTTAAFTWETAEQNHAAKVKLGTSATSMTDVHTGYVWTMSTSATLGAANSMHEVHVCGLQPATTYYYVVGGGPAGKEVWSAPQQFTTVPASGTITVGLLGDARDTVTTWQLAHQRMRDAGVALQLVDGDVVLTAGIESQYQQWLDAIWKDPNSAGKFLTLGQQMMVVIDGNHEADVPNSFANWALPGVAKDPYAETYASFDVGSTHFVMIDDNAIGTISGGSVNPEATAQLAWLDKDLAAANADRKAHPFIVAMNHRGLFSTSNHASDSDVLAARGALAPLFDKYKVDLVVNGHDHEYERSKPLTAGNPPSGLPVVGTGTQYVIAAGAGASPYAVGTDPASYSSGVQVSFCTSLSDPGCTSKYVGVYTIATLTPTTLTLKAYGLVPSSTTQMDDPVIDTVTLTAQ